MPSQWPYRAALSWPADPSDEELARNWTLCAVDKVKIQGCRGDDNRLRFALQLCVLQLCGRLARQLALRPVLLLDPAPQPATHSEYQQQLRHDLGYQLFDPDVQTTLEQ